MSWDQDTRYKTGADAPPVDGASEAWKIGAFLADHPWLWAVVSAHAEIHFTAKHGRAGAAALMAETSESLNLTTRAAQEHVRDWLAASRVERCPRCLSAVIELPSLQLITWPLPESTSHSCVTLAPAPDLAKAIGDPLRRVPENTSALGKSERLSGRPFSPTRAATPARTLR